MTTGSGQVELSELLEYYSDGLYTQGEVVLRGLEILAKDEESRPQLWASLPAWAHDGIKHVLRSWPEEEFCRLRGPEFTTEERAAVSSLKAWLVAHSMF